MNSQFHQNITKFLRVQRKNFSFIILVTMSRESLGARSSTAFFWGAGGTAIRMVLQFSAQVVIARALGPTEYGVFSIGLLAVTFSMFFADVGLATSLVQKKELCSEDIRFVFTWQVLIGAFVAASLSLGSSRISEFFDEPRAGMVISALSLLCLINAVAAPSNNILRRNLNQQALQKAGIFSYFVGFVCVGIPLALIYESVWALVVAWLVQAILAAALGFTYVRHPLKPLIWYSEARSQGGYGLIVFGTNIINWFINNIDRIIIGRLLPTRDIGVYGQAYNFFYSPTASVMGVVYPIMFSAASRLTERERKEKLAQAHLGISGAIILVFLPLFSCAAAVAPTLVAALFGADWKDAADIFLPVSIAMVPWMLYGISTPLLWVNGNKSDELVSQLPLSVMWGVSCYFVCTYYGALGVAWGLCIFMAVRWMTVARLAWRSVGINFRDFLFASRYGLFVSVVCVSSVSLLDWILGSVSPIYRLPILLISGLSVFVLACLMMVGKMAPSLRMIIIMLSEKLPQSARAVLVKRGFVR